MFSIPNLDRTAEATGVPSPNSPVARRPSLIDEDGIHEDTPTVVPAHERGQPSLRSYDSNYRLGTGTSTLKNPSAEAFSAWSTSKSLVNDEAKTDSDEAKIDSEVTDLAKTLSKRSSSWSSVPDSPFHPEPDSALDPNSKNFRPRQWIKSMIKLQEAENKNPGRTAGVAFRNLNVHGFGSATDYQKDVGNVWLELFGYARSLLGMSKPRRIDILRDLEGIVHHGEMLVVLGPPGSGCSTFLKTITGETHGFVVDEGSHLNYKGIPPKQMHKYFRGEAIYTAEVDVHFPMLTVSETLTFAARARAPKVVPGGLTSNKWAEHLRDVVMASFGISHTKNTRVGNDFVRGVSGGERKRVTIAEASLSSAPLQAWDNSTRGLDSANAVEFCKTLRTSSELMGSAACVAIYQAPQAAYDLFDKALVLYEGRQIFFGSSKAAKHYFEEMGFYCPDRQTTADFLTSMTSPQERVVREGFQGKVPRTPDEFAAAWKASPERAQLLKEIDEYDAKYPFEGEDYNNFVQSRQAQQAKGQRLKSPYTLSYAQQVQLCLWRGFLRFKADPSITINSLLGNSMNALILGSVFYNMQPNTDSFFSRGAVIFFAILFNAFGSALEVLTLYAQRPIVEKHDRYALYHPSAEAFASMLTDMPFKFANSILFNLALYFMSNLRRTPGAFFFFWFIGFITTLTMSMMFRSTAALSRTLSQAMVPTAMLILAVVIFAGFAIPTTYMLGWCRWINWLNPVAYAFESLMVNEFYDRQYECSMLVPAYGSLTDNTQVCSAVGSVPGQDFVSGEAFIESSYNYYHSHKYRNVGIIFAFMFFLMCVYLTATELISAKKSKGEVLVFRRGHTPASLKEKSADEEDTGARSTSTSITRQQSFVEASDVIQRQTAIFSWKNVCYDIKIKKEERRILDHVDGWVKPGTLTALMGVSGAGKTTLLDVLATRVTMGVISGDIWVDGRQRDSSFQRKTGYVQQQDLHLETTTVREALVFSAVLRQPASTPRSEKVAYVDEVIKLLDMQEYADAVIGVPGEGLNVEQRKRLTIGVELAAKPALLLFLDEPTSGLDSQTSWAILDLLEKLKNSGQAILCTIHQPSAMLFQRFDRLLFLAAGGKTVYFGEVGENSHVLANYFESNGAPKCPAKANPAEWMLEVIGAAPGSHSEIDWFQTWRNSQQYREVHDELDRLERDRPQEAPAQASDTDVESYREFAAPFGTQLWETLRRVFSQYWRTPSYIYSKISLCLFASIFIGFVFFKSPLTHQGLQNQLFSIFMLFIIFGQLTQQIMPHFVTQRSLYEVRERPSKAYSWKAFMMSNIIVELPWNSLCAVIIFFCIYYPIGLYKNAEPSDSVHLRGAQFFLFTLQYLLFASSFTNMLVAGISSAEAASNFANLLFSLSVMFCGVLATPTSLPGFWIFMYRVSPFTYLVEGMLASGLANQVSHCADNEYLTFNPPANESCATYMDPYIARASGYLSNPDHFSDCQYCTYNDTNVFLDAVSIHYSNVWRDYGILWAYIIFNIAAAVFIYWIARVPKNPSKKEDKKTASEATPGAGAGGDNAEEQQEVSAEKKG